MPKDTYQFSIRNAAGQYFAVVAGSVVIQPDPNYLKKSIIDWATFQMQWKRHPVYKGVFRNFSPDTVRFTNDGAKILRHIYNTLGGRNGVANLEIRKLNKTDQQYYFRGKCAIDFSKYINSKGDLDNVSVMLMEGGLSALLQAYDTTDYEIPVGIPGDDPDADYLWMDGVNLLGNYNYQSMINADNLIEVSSFSHGGIGDYEQSTLGVVFIDEEGAYPVGTTQSVLPNDQVPGGTFNTAHLFKALHAFSGKLKVELNFSSIQNASLSDRNCKLSLWAHTYAAGGWGVPITSVKLWEDPDGFITPGNVSSTIAASSETLYTGGWSYNYAQNESLVLAWRVEVNTVETSGNSNMQVVLAGSATPITLDYQYTQATTTCQALTHWKVFKKLSNLLTGTAIDPVSDLLTTDDPPNAANYNLNPKHTYFASGDCLRQLNKSADGTPTDPSIKTNVSDFHKDAFVTLGAGLGIEISGGDEVLRLEKLSHFYQKGVLIADLGSKITKFKSYPYNDYVGNNIKLGYKTQTYDDVNGRFEFNAETDLQTPLVRINTKESKDLDYISPYRHDCYGEEFVRANLANKKTTDSGSDNETFKVQSTGNTYAGSGIVPYPYLIDRANGIISGLPVEVQASVFNVPFTPGRNAGRLKPWLKSNYADIPGPVLKFTTGTKNTTLVAEMATSPGLVITENADVDITHVVDTDDLLFLPTVLEFEAESPIDMPDLMATNPYGVFRLKEQGVTLDGFVLECGITDATNEIYNFKLLLSPNTPLPLDF